MARVIYEFNARETLRVKQCGKIGMIDTGVGASGDRWLAVKGDAKTRFPQHRKIIGAVANGEGVRDLQSMLAPQAPQRRDLGVASKHRDQPLRQ